MIIFFFASAAASSAYLTVSEIFPLEIRALAIAFFYAIGTGLGGIAGPWLFGALIDTGSRASVSNGYLERIPLKSKHILHGERSSCIL
jgi:MFS family permease